MDKYNNRQNKIIHNTKTHQHGFMTLTCTVPLAWIRALTTWSSSWVDIRRRKCVVIDVDELHLMHIAVSGIAMKLPMQNEFVHRWNERRRFGRRKQAHIIRLLRRPSNLISWKRIVITHTHAHTHTHTHTHARTHTHDIQLWYWNSVWNAMCVFVCACMC